MTSHLTDSMLAAVLEHDGSVTDAVRLHLVECGACRVALATAEAQRVKVHQLLELMPATQPDIDPVEFVNGVASRSRIARANRRTRYAWSRRLAYGAVAAAVITASAAALVPKSALRRFVHAVAVASGITSPHSSVVTDKLKPSQPSPRGVEIFPHGRVEVLFRANQSAGVVRVVPTSGTELSVAGADNGPDYTVGTNTIVVSNRPADSVSFVVGIPQLSDSDSVYVRIAGKTVYSNVGNKVTAVVPADHNGHIILSFQNSRR